MCSCQSIPECCVMFFGVKLSMGSFVLFVSFLQKVTLENIDASYLLSS